MGVQSAISVEEYLHTSFKDLDREYRAGELVERSLPDYLHGKVQALLCAFFVIAGRRFSLFPCAETRMRLGPNLILIPDVAVFHPVEPRRVPESPPMVAIEVLSLDDRLTEVREKLEEYRAWGVPHVWLVDPHSRRFYTCDGGLIEVTTLEIPELALAIAKNDVFVG